MAGLNHTTRVAGDAPLTAAEVASVRERLRRRFGEVWDDVQREVRRFDPDLYQRVAGEAPDAGDQSLADLVVDVGHAEVHRDIRELRAIDGALLRIAAGSYGRCEDCGSQIDRARLQAEPAAARCRDCQTAYEKHHAGTGGPRF